MCKNQISAPARKWAEKGCEPQYSMGRWSTLTARTLPLFSYEISKNMTCMGSKWRRNFKDSVGKFSTVLTQFLFTTVAVLTHWPSLQKTAGREAIAKERAGFKRNSTQLSLVCKVPSLVDVVVCAETQSICSTEAGYSKNILLGKEIYGRERTCANKD